MELQQGAVNWYNQQTTEIPIIEAFNKEAAEKNDAARLPDGTYPENFVPLPLKSFKLKHKVFKVLESWWMRYLIAIAFIFIVPKIKAIINGENKEPDEEDETNEFEEFMEFQRFKRGR